MHIIQVLVVVFALYAIVRTWLRYRRGAMGAGESAAWTGLWLLVSVCVLAPGITQRLAGILGVGRGVDAVMYLAILALVYAFFRLYLRLRQQDQQLTRLVRRLALKEAEHDQPHEHDNSKGPSQRP